MVLISAAVAISKKVMDDRARKKEARQGVLSVGNSDVARKAFASQTTKTLQDGNSGIQRAGTEIKYEDSTSVDAMSPTGSNPGISSPMPEMYETRVAPTSQQDATSSAIAETAILTVASPARDSTDSAGDRSTRVSIPPPYSPRAESSTQSPSVYSRDSDGGTPTASDTMSILTSSSKGVAAVKVRTKGEDLRSGFPYHPELFELQVHPQKWDTFCSQLIDTTKLGIGDHAQIWAAATATALTGAWVTSVFIGKGMTRRIQEDKIKAGRENTSDGGLGDLLQQWNDGYFRDRGLFAHLELSDSAMKHPDQKSRLLRKGTHWYPTRQERDKKRADRKFAIILTKLDDDGKPADALHELSSGSEAAVIPELPSGEDARYNIAEMPGDEGRMPVELPGDLALPAGVSLGYGSEKLEPPAGYAELDSETTELLGKTTLDEDDPDEELRPSSLMVTGSTHEALSKETT